jgi:hypothetical protein
MTELLTVAAIGAILCGPVSIWRLLFGRRRR